MTKICLETKLFHQKQKFSSLLFHKTVISHDYKFRLNLKTTIYKNPNLTWRLPLQVWIQNKRQLKRERVFKDRNKHILRFITLKIVS